MAQRMKRDIRQLVSMDKRLKLLVDLVAVIRVSTVLCQHQIIVLIVCIQEADQLKLPDMLLFQNVRGGSGQIDFAYGVFCLGLFEDKRHTGIGFG